MNSRGYSEKVIVLNQAKIIMHTNCTSRCTFKTQANNVITGPKQYTLDNAETYLSLYFDTAYLACSLTST